VASEKKIGLSRLIRRKRKIESSRKNREALSFRRTTSLMLYWQDNQLVFENYACQNKIVAEPLTCAILHFCGEWRTLGEICAFLDNFREASVIRSLKLLWKNRILERSDEKRDPRVKAMENWTSWNPAAGYFHFSTKDTEFVPDPWGSLQDFVRKKQEPMPLPLKSETGARKTKLPRAPGAGEFPKILRERRTWRVYGNKAVSLEALAECLELTFGIQGWVKVPSLGRAAMKTSPSCGCLHPIEAYVVVQKVKGLKPGMYHYNAEGHELEWLRAGVGRKTLERSLGNQWWFAKGAFLVMMTAVFERTRWKYEIPRVYRGILIEAGHLCQTFCLTATWLGLAPFCTIALADTQWEKWLGIDGISESVLYVAGAGTRPKDVQDAHMGMIGKR
jgi:SagB-type dehydrogenase family enzyme